MGAATTAVYSVTLKMARNQEGYTTRSFFKAFRENFRQSTVIWLILLVMGAIIGADLMVYLRSSSVSPLGMLLMTAFFAAAVLFIFESVYVFALQAYFDNSVKRTMGNALIMAVRHLPSSIAMTAAGVLLTALGVLVFPPVFLGGQALLAWINSFLLVRIFDRYPAAGQPRRDRAITLYYQQMEVSDLNTRPNILLVMTDHQRADSLGMVQCGREVTPNLNRLMREATTFTRAYDTCPLCVPARTALATGIYPTKNGVVYNDWKGATAGDWEPFHKTLQNSGYHVGHAGVDHIRVKPFLRDQGLDFFVNQEDYNRWAEDLGVTTSRAPSELTLVLEEVDGRQVQQKYSSHKVSRYDYPLETFKDFYFLDQSLKFLRERPWDRPFALFTYLWAPIPLFGFRSLTPVCTIPCR